MTEWYDDDGVRFAYPESWELVREETDGGVTLTVNADGTSFWTLALYPAAVVGGGHDRIGGPPPEEYPESDVYPLRALWVFRGGAGCRVCLPGVDKNRFAACVRDSRGLPRWCSSRAPIMNFVRRGRFSKRSPGAWL
ncbi:MAG: hypothetical protein Ct9H300mP1_17110 [Planctomycetaceae bacterium]|nr:MAG: hypothetical protein Ct9H300mP1_17110 [Planctomycetaceae bacterium]